MKYSLSQVNEASADLFELLEPGDTLHTVLRHVSKSGMSRDIDVYKLVDSEAIWLSWKVARLLDEPMHNDAIRVRGAGMDMGFHLVYGIGQRLWPEGFTCIGENCPSNDHLNGYDAEHHRSGGYALRHRWM